MDIGLVIIIAVLAFFGGALAYKVRERWRLWRYYTRGTP